MRLFLIACLCSAPVAPALEIGGRDIPADQADGLEAALERAGDNAAQLEKAFAQAPAAQLEGLAFLVRFMPERDLRSLSAEFLLENLDWACKARAAVPWGESIPDELFLNDVLPYASINERRDNWRKDFFERFLPLVKDCKTPGEAAQVLNRDMWKLVDVRYHARKRPKPDQSPYESMEAKFASCSGLSVLLIDACRAVCVPARFVGTPLWSNKRGNHSWVEVWDGEWKFTGACEYSAAGLNRAWFAGSAAQATDEDWRHAIYASSWRKSEGELRFPLVWNLDIRWVNAENVTGRYAAKVERKLFIEVFERPGGERIACEVEILRGGEKIGGGRSRDAGNDTNDMLGFTLEAGREVEVQVALPDGRSISRKATPAEDRDLVIEIFAEQPER